MDNVDLGPSNNENEQQNDANDKTEKQQLVPKQEEEPKQVKQESEEKKGDEEQAEEQAEKFRLGKMASSGLTALKSTGKKIINNVSAAIMPSESKDNKESLYRGDYSKDMKEPKWKPKKRFVANPGSIVRRQKRVLVTGGAGFIGSHLVDALMDKGYDVICADNLFSGQKCNVYKWFGNPNFEFMRHDVCNPLYVEVDEIYHLACPASPVFYQNNPIKTVKVKSKSIHFIHA